MWDGSESSYEGVITFYKGGIRKKWIELGNPETFPISYEIIRKPSYIDLSEEEGVIDIEKRIYISVNDDEVFNGRQAELIIRLDEKGQTIRIRIITGEDSADDGVICIYAEDYIKNNAYNVYKPPLDKAGWYEIYGMGREGNSAVMAYNPMLESMGTEAVSENPYIEYKFSLYNEGEFELEIIRFLTLDSVGRIRFGISVDGMEPVIVESETRDEWCGNWHDSVMDNGERMYYRLPYLHPGTHTLRLYMIDNYITISKFVIYTEERRTSYYGFSSKHYIKDMPEVNFHELDNLCSSMYCRGCRKSEAMMPTMWTEVRTI